MAKNPVKPVSNPARCFFFHFTRVDPTRITKEFNGEERKS